MSVRAKLFIIGTVTLLALIALALLLINSASFKAPSSNVGPNTIQSDGLYYDVVYVYDGDTISVNMMGANEKIRLIGVDTPETMDPDTPPQCYGQESSNYTKTNLSMQKVRLEADPTNQNRDRYGRLLRYVYLSDGRLWNIELIANGYGFAYLRFPFTKQQEFSQAENKSSNLKLGLWGKCEVNIKNGVYRTNSL